MTELVLGMMSLLWVVGGDDDNDGEMAISLTRLLLMMIHDGADADHADPTMVIIVSTVRL